MRTPSIPSDQPVVLLAQAVTAAIILAVFVSYLLLSFPFDSDWRAVDVEAYWSAAERLRSGENVYAEVPRQPYTYSPWFAYAWVPLTYLPRAMVESVWLAILLGCVAWLSYPLVKSLTTLLLGLVVLPQVIEYAWIGNVDALMLVALALFRSPAGPVFVGLAASLKVTPIAFVGFYLGRREWKRAAIATAVTAALWAPALAFDVSTIGVVGHNAIPPHSLMAFGPAVWVVGVALIAGVVTYVAWRDRRTVIIAAAVLAMIGNPRMSLYSVGYLLIPAREQAPHPGRAR